MPGNTRYEELARSITERYARLPNRLQGIARFALGNPDAIALSTVAQIARDAAVPPSAVIRFANALGYPGFTDLQRIFRERLVARSATYRERIEALRRGGDDEGHVYPQVTASAVRELERLRDHGDPRVLAAAARLVAGAHTVYLLAQRRAFAVAAYLAYGLAQLEIRAVLLDSVGGMLRDQVRSLRHDDVLVVASFRNYTDDVVAAANTVRAQGGSVVALTDTAVSPLARSASITIEIGDDPSVPFRTLAAPLCAAQALVMSVGYVLGEGGEPAPSERQCNRSRDLRPASVSTRRAPLPRV
ncbi:MAG: MurR/RpiR family transcriptional regulator [Burkholderiales bacterium]|nr:MurR/RpiR family transcriptional regulator [Burkholderiales bacterium]